MQLLSKYNWLLALLLVGALAAGLWMFYNKVYVPNYKPYKQVHPDSELVLEIADLQAFAKQWTPAQSTHLLQKISPITDDSSSLFVRFLQWAAQNHKPTEPTQRRGLFTLSADNSLEGILPAQGLPLSLLRNSWPQNHADTLWQPAADRLTIGGTHDSLYILQSGSSLIVRNCPLPAQPNAHNFWQSHTFEQLRKVRGKRAATHLFLRYPHSLHRHKMGLWWHCSGLDLYSQKQSLLMSGYSFVHDSLPQIGQLLQSQQAQGFSIPSQLPYTTLSYLHFSLHNHTSYHQAWQDLGKAYYGNSDYKKYVYISPQQQQMAAYQARWWAGEMAFLQTASLQSYAVFKATQGREASRQLAALSAHIGQYKNVEIRRMRHPHYLPKVFGLWFQSFAKPYFAIIDEWVIFAHSRFHLQAYIQAITQGHILQKNEQYQRYAQNIAEGNSFTAYGMQHSTAKALFPALQHLPFVQQATQSSLQLHWQNAMLYTSLHCDYTPIQAPKKQSQWQSETEGDIAAQACMAHNAQGRQQYLVFDNFHKLYMISQKGNIAWDMQLPQPIIGRIHELYQHGKYYYAFATAQQLYLIDSQGRFAPGFPIAMEAEATTGVSPIRVGGHKASPRLLLAAANGQIYSYTIDGKATPGWQCQNTRRRFHKALYHVVSRGKDYIVAEADNHEVLMFDRRGKKRLQIRQSFENALGADFYDNKTNSKGIMISTDTDGKLVYVPRKGKVRKTDFGSFSAKHFFLYLDINNNGQKDFIYLDGRKLQAYNKFKKTLFTYSFEHAISHKPQTFSYRGKTYICVFDAVAKEAYIFDDKGLATKKIQSDTPPLLIQESNKAFLLLSRKKALLKYPFSL